jgi:sugar lactone lactonase YvrE
MKTILVVAALVCSTAASLCVAGETRSWLQADAPSFQKGNLKGLAVRSDGRLSLAPRISEVYDSSTAYLWAMVRDSRGNLYAGGGPGAKLFRITPDGKGAKLAEFDSLEIHALAIDSKDRVYVATAPDGKIYRVDEKGASAEFYAPGQKYIWAMVFDAADNLYVATGDKGEVHRVTPDGKGAVFFRTDETHARSLALDHDGNLIVGTEPGGLVIRVSKNGESFVLYQMAKKEVTALAIGPQNEVFAAAVGTRTAPALPAAAPAFPAQALPTSGTIVMTPIGQPAAPQPAPLPAAGGSEVYRIPAKSSPEKVWTSTQDFVYALALDAGGHLMIGSGNKGALYRVESRALYTTLTNFPIAQVTSLVTAKDGTVYAATGNVGKIFRTGPGFEAEGTIESDVFDSGGFSTWGRISAGADLHGGTLRLSARSGNLDRPQKNWSAWSQPVNGPDGGRVDIPAARFVQWKATLTAAPGGSGVSPTLDSVATAYLRENIAPRIDTVEATLGNYRFPAPAIPLTLSSPSTLALPALGTAPPAPGNLDASIAPPTPIMSYAKGWQGVRWAASDENGDSLIFKVEIRGEKEQTWKLLRDKVYERYFAFDSAAFPDGDYRVRITASDSPSNTPENALASTEESDPFTIDNSPPRITSLKAGAAGAIEWHASDELSTIRKAEYSLDGADWTVVEPVAKLSDAKALDYSLTLKNLAAGEHTVAVRVTDDCDNVAVDKLVIR